MNNRKVFLSLILGLVIGLLVVGAVAAQTGNGYDLTWWTVDGGGGTVIGGGYTINGTIGQPDSGSMQGGGYILSGGFWAGAGSTDFQVYLPLVLK